MSLFKLPTETDGDSNPFYSFRAELEELSYTFTFYWNTRRARWSFDLIALDGEEIITGQTVHPNLNLLRRSVSAQKPPGLLICLPENPSGVIFAPALNDLGATYSLVYYTSDDSALA